MLRDKANFGVLEGFQLSQVRKNHGLNGLNYIIKLFQWR